ncbi:MAG: hypothetical protein JOY65_03430 [Acetobacteraceae bacterium]|nr:hypothetical protein [Acetobacteraceae bacterium]
MSLVMAVLALLEALLAGAVLDGSPRRGPCPGVPIPAGDGPRRPGVRRMAEKAGR